MENLYNYLMKHINESYGVSEPVKILTEYVFKQLEDLMYTDSDDEDLYDNALIELCKEYGDEYPIEINFRKVKGFEYKKYDLLTFKDIKGDWADVKCDLIVNVTKDAPGFGGMNVEYPILDLNIKFFRKREIFEKNIIHIRNTIGHELLHYIQHMSKKSAGLTKVKSDSDSVNKNIIDAIEAGKKRYYLINFLLYAVNPIEEDARNQGFYETMHGEIEKRLQAYLKNVEKENKKIKKNNKNQRNKSNKEYLELKTFNFTDFCNYVIYHKDYLNNVLHMGFFREFEEGLKNDTWENYKVCFDDPEDKDREDSMIYALLNICDNRETTPFLPMPSKNNFVMHINSEEKFNSYQKRLLAAYSKNINRYEAKLRKVIYYVLEETKLLEKYKIKE